MAINQDLEKKRLSHTFSSSSTKPEGSYNIIFEVAQVLESGCTARVKYFNDGSQSHFPQSGIVYIKGCTNVGEGDSFQAFLKDDGLFEITRNGAPSKLHAFRIVNSNGDSTSALQQAPDIAPTGYPSSRRARVGGGW